MKIVNKLALLFMSLLVCVACSKEQASNDTYQGEVKPLSLELSAEVEDDEPRSIHAVLANGKTGKLQMAEKDLSVRIAIRQGAGAPLYHTLTFKKVEGKNQATFKGKVDIPTGGSGAYTLSAIVLEEVGGHKYARLDGNLVKPIAGSELVLPSGGKVDTKVPYVAEPKTLVMHQDGKSFAPTTLTFKPSGSLIAFRVDNRKGLADITVSKLKIQSNAFVVDWAYDMANLSGGNLLQGKADVTSIDKTYTLPAPLTVAQGELSTVYYYLTAMPVKEENNLNTVVTLVKADGSEVVVSANARQLLAGTVPATLRVPGVKVPDSIEESCFKSKRLPIEFLAHYNVANGGTSFDKTMGNTNSAYYTQADAKAKFENGINIEGTRYYLPTQPELRAILPIRTLHLRSGAERLNEKEKIAADQEEYDTTADYRVETTEGNELPRKVYALRLKHKDLCMQTAYRYEFVGEFTPGSTTSHLKVTCRYLGNNEVWTLDDVANEKFWSSNTGKDIIRYIPATSGANVTRKAGQNGSYWTSSPSPGGQAGYGGDFGFAYYAGRASSLSPFQMFFETYGEHSNLDKLLSVRLISRQPVQPVNVAKP